MAFLVVVILALVSVASAGSSCCPSGRAGVKPKASCGAVGAGASGQTGAEAACINLDGNLLGIRGDRINFLEGQPVSIRSQDLAQQMGRLSLLGRQTLREMDYKSDRLDGARGVDGIAIAR